MEARKRNLSALILGMVALAGCKGGNSAELTSRLNEANSKVVACRNEVNELKNQNSEESVSQASR